MLVEEKKIGFDYQRRLDGNCGQRALMHALLILGHPVSEDEAHQLTDRPRWKTRLTGTDERHMKLGVRRAGFKPLARVSYDRAEAHHEIDAMLESSFPVIICVEDQQHWAVLAGKASSSQYYWIDSADDDLYGTWTWTDIADWMETNGEYYFIGVAPKTKADRRTSAVPDFFRMYQGFDDDDLAEYWGWYLEDLRKCFDLPEHTAGAINARAFFERYGKTIYDACKESCRSIDEDQLHYEYGNYRKVAFVHNMSVSRERIEEAIARLTSAVTFTAML
ncbi:MAG: hypothetical protein WB699_04165 [Bacteroidota bacterium]